MFPWLWFWSPHLQYPLSGSVEQDYKPFTNWGFFGAIKPEAGDGQIEQKIFDVATYGRQLGLITEVIMKLVKEAAPEWLKDLEELEELEESIKSKKLKNLEELEELEESGKLGNLENLENLAPLIPLIPLIPLVPLRRLKKIQKDIEEIKKKDLEAKIDDIETVVKKLQSREDHESRKIIAKIRELL